MFATHPVPGQFSKFVNVYMFFISLTHDLEQLGQKTREGCGCPKFIAGRVFRQIFDTAGEFFPDFPAARSAIPAKLGVVLPHLPGEIFKAILVNFSYF